MRLEPAAPRSRVKHSTTEPLRSLRKCNLCDSGTVGDEFHYVLECCFFDFDRKIFLPHIKRKPVNCFTHANIFNDTNFRRLRRLCNVLKIVIDTFRSRPR